MKKALKGIIIGCICLCILGTVGFFVTGNALFNRTLARKTDIGYAQGLEKRWIAQNSEDLYITSEDGLRLHAHLKENPDADGKYALLCHGGSSNATTMEAYAKKLYEMGFSLLCPNARAHGKSEGDVRGMGYLERRDNVLWINEIVKNDPSAQILLFGVSVGGSTVLFTSGEKDLPENVKAVISDCGFTTVYEEYGNVIRRFVPFLPDFPVVDSMSVVCKIRGGYSFRKASCVEAVKRSVTPTLFIHGSEDTRIPVSMLHTLYDNAACPKEKLIIEGAEHANSHAVNPELYWSTVSEFIYNNFT